MKLLFQLLVNGIINASLYAMMAIGFGIVYRTTYIFHMVYGGFFVAAAYFLYIFAVLCKFPIFLAVLISIFFSSLLGYLVEKGVYLPFYKKKAGSGVVLIASLGVFIVVENLISMIFGNEVKVVSDGIEPSYKLGYLILTRIQIVEFVVGLIGVSIFWMVISKVKIFKALWAMGENPELISILGISLFKLRALVFIISSAFIAIPACLISIDVGMEPHMGMSYLLISIVAVIFGGIESFPGWILGAVIIAELHSLTVWQFSSRWMDLVTFTLLVLILLFRPEGLLGVKKRVEEK